MQCVGTLSWSGMGVGRWSTTAATKSRRHGLRRGRRGVVWRRRRLASDGRLLPADAQSEKTIPSGHLSAAHGGETRWTDPLEIDWSQIVRRCMDGDSGAWSEMVRTHHKRVYGLCYRFTGNVADAEDLTQDVFLKIYSNLASFDTAPRQPAGVDHDNDPQPAGGQLPPHEEPAGDGFAGRWLGVGRRAEADRPADVEGPSPHEQAAQKELSAMVQSALARVSVELREAVILRDLQDMDYKEIAQVLGIPEGTVKSRISRGRAELARLLERNKREVM